MKTSWPGLSLLLLGVFLTPNMPAAAPTNHWAFERVADVKPQQVRDAPWCRTPIDRFVRASQERAGVSPSVPADPRTLIRRITFDVTGLPPEPSEVDAFVRTTQQNPTGALDSLIERLLASPHYGERWGRWWLDVARYADTNGQDENKVLANAWRYRDWVVHSFNRNLPFDQFIVDQLAGDLLPPAASEPENFDPLIATGFLVLGPKMLAEQDKPKLVMDIVDEQIDTVGKAFLGLTLGCARCHDHKFDPIPASDYYAIAGIFKSTRTMEDLAFVSKFNERPISPSAEMAILEAYAKRLKAQTNQIQEIIRDANAALVADLKHELPKDPGLLYPPATRERLAALEKERDTIKSNAPPPAAYAMSVAEDKPVNLPVHLRGSHLNLARDPVPRGFIQIVSRHELAHQIPREQSGRLQLARWITSPKNPLTARVIVNRLWQAHFGEGLVRTPDNFGLRGEKPTHPELLDWLAGEFVRTGWDVKALHRLILRSAAYQQSSGIGKESEAGLVDPENRLLSRFPRQRLEAEMIRDALLAVSGRLDTAAGGSLVNWKNNDYVPADDVTATSVRRTVYLPIIRDRVYDALTIFDFANPSVCSARRTPTVVSHQALFFLNSPLVKDCALAVARSLLARNDLDDSARVREAYNRILSRPASEPETRLAIRFLRQLPGDPRTVSSEENQRMDDFALLCQTLLASNEFVYYH